MPLAKGPSFGALFSILCPFIYLAHYDLVATRAGRDTLRACGVNPYLLRLAVGLEGVDAVVDALRKGVDSLCKLKETL